MFAQSSLGQDTSGFDASNYADSNFIATIDNITADSTELDSAAIVPKRKSSLEHQVEYKAQDSMRVDLISQKVYLYGAAKAVYGDINLEADYIEIELEKSELLAHGLPDSTGKIAGFPIFTQGDNVFRSEEMRYNFKTRKGLSKEVKTQESGGYLHGETVKRDSNESIYIKNGKFTTCEYDDPHFHIQSTKIKVIPQDKIITGPSYLAIANIPTPLALPFGFFPNSEKHANGIIIPSYGQNRVQGFYLSRGGYYYGINDNIDIAITGDIFTRGSWATYATSRYVRRYKYRGNLELGYINNRYSIEGYPDFSISRNIKVNWTHSQDAKARPNSTFNASVNAGSVGSVRSNPMVSLDQSLQSTLNSQITYGIKFPNSPFNLTLSARSTQNTQDSSVRATLPSALLTMQRIFPFKSKTTSKKNLLSDIGISATLEGRNEIMAKEDTLFTRGTFENMKNGVQLSLPISTSFKLLKFITISPSMNNRFVGYLESTRQFWNEADSTVGSYQVNGTTGFWEGNVSASATTKIYGTYQFGKGALQAVRHTITPQASLGWKPDYTQPQWGYFSEVVYDTLGRTRRYSYFDQKIYSAPGAKQNGVINFSVLNTIEAKVRDNKDTTNVGATKKVKVLDALNFSSSYSLAADSLNLTPVAISARTQVIKGLILNANSVLDPYAINAAGERINHFQYLKNGKAGRWTAASVNMTWSLKPKTKKKTELKSDSLTTEDKKARLLDQGLYYTDFIDFDIPWSLNFTYNLNYSRPGLTKTVSQSLIVRGDIGITSNWKVTFSTGYNFIQKQITSTSINIYRNMHCWEMSAQVIPFGPLQRYTLTIGAKPGILQDLKLNRSRNFQVPGYN